VGNGDTSSVRAISHAINIATGVSKTLPPAPRFQHSLHASRHSRPSLDLSRASLQPVLFCKPPPNRST
jgi:hypothetical protein